MNPLVSVILPTFDREALVLEAIESALSQTYGRLEVIVSDDGSSDGTVDAVRGLTDRRVQLLQHEHGGVGAARNLAIERAGGQILAFLDSDDRWAPEALERMVGAIEHEPDLDGAYGRVEEFHDGGAAARGARDTRAPLPSATIVRRASFERVGPFATQWRVGEWVEWYARALDAGLRLIPVASATIYRRLHDRNQGLSEAEHRGDYASVLKGVLDRRRALADRDPR